MKACCHFSISCHYSEVVTYEQDIVYTQFLGNTSIGDTRRYTWVDGGIVDQ